MVIRSPGDGVHTVNTAREDVVDALKQDGCGCLVAS